MKTTGNVSPTNKADTEGVALAANVRLMSAKIMSRFFTRNQFIKLRKISVASSISFIKRFYDAVSVKKYRKWVVKFLGFFVA